ncbi:MAG TPA: AMP-binding protein, partial [Candidatus Poseidoniia archaeon]|nr:AMP-binding protein [Candidatus Poseidoniia archaeon]
MSNILWNPSEERKNSSLVQKFIEHTNLGFDNYFDLHNWSIKEVEIFWEEFWKFSGIVHSKNYDSVLTNPVMPGAKWFVGSRLNYAENLLSGNSDQIAIISTGEGRDDEVFTFKELNKIVASVQKGLRKLGVKEGTRVAAFVPNCVETVILMLAVAASGAIWTSCSPDFGCQGVIDRFGQVKPSILVVADGYNYNGKVFGLEEKINGVLETIDSIQHVICIDFVSVSCNLIHNSIVNYKDLLSNSTNVPNFAQLPFDHPLYIMYSSGTTGPPKSIVHGAGGTLIQHMKEHQLQCDIQRGRDTLFWFTTCGWMMWNWLVSSLAIGSSIVLYEGNPFYPHNDSLLDIMNDIDIDIFGTSAKYISTLESLSARPDNFKFERLRSILSTGSTLTGENYEYVYNSWKENVQLSSISG